MDALLTGQGLIALLTLAFLEIILGVDNIIFISIVSDRLPKDQQKKARTLGLSLALIFRIGLLLAISWIIAATTPIFSIGDFAFSWRDLILLSGGLFLLAKSTTEIHHKVQGEEEGPDAVKSTPRSLGKVLVQIVLLDIVFSFDSILTAVGLTDNVTIMIIAVIIAMGVMITLAGKISDFINKHPSLQILALSFLIMIGVMLVAEAFHSHVPKGYIYSSVAFSLIVELINMKFRNNNPIQLRGQKMPKTEDEKVD